MNPVCTKGFGTVFGGIAAPHHCARCGWLVCKDCKIDNATLAPKDRSAAVQTIEAAVRCIEVLVLTHLALLLDSSGGAEVLLILNAESDGGVEPPPLSWVLLLLKSINKEDAWGHLTLALSCCASDRAANAALLVIVSTKIH